MEDQDMKRLERSNCLTAAAALIKTAQWRIDDAFKEIELVGATEDCADALEIASAAHEKLDVSISMIEAERDGVE